MEAPDPRRCPLCGGPNGCARAAPRPAGAPEPACWCSAERFPAALLERLPPRARRTACICRDCLERALPPRP